MDALILRDDRCLDHDPGPGHPERAERLRKDDQQRVQDREAQQACEDEHRDLGDALEVVQEPESSLLTAS